ncbi:ABC transporter ATP-binding protein [Puniceicoccales bacterium CK1056]|uniref:ABC transporter ATP-binding protein n=1 Tax=Oceanipulchritudo coccoides TaxID=2706888 RepID=A0A6B2M3G1_9BACT|nr:ABC transporter ATP-binding protein [Oceanipulchritudo coccoides]NDV62230.1 ABC transporter ATP-binding protein [Oceanipulchritudo coccoides]
MTAPDDHAIQLRNVSKVYRIPAKGRESFLGSMTVMFDALLGNYGKRHGTFRQFDALEPLDVMIGRGESMAIVGRNGSGKSTLLQIIAGTLRATTGTVQVNGSLCALLELGSGFNPEFTGMENIYLNGAMLGLERKRIENKLEDILAFAEIGEFVDQPVRTYSSGMRLRLAFAVITAVDPEILIIDEALSVGDAFFQSRCVRWLEDYLERGNTFICVSHDMFMIQRLCRRGIVLDDGRKAFEGDISDAANLYYRLHGKGAKVGGRLLDKDEPADEEDKDDEDDLVSVKDEAGWWLLNLRIKERTGNQQVTIEKVWTQPNLQEGIPSGKWLKVKIQVRAREPIELFHFGFGFRDRSGQLIGGYHSFYEEKSVAIESAGQGKIITCEFKLDLKPQMYLLVIGLAINHTADDWQDLDCIWDCAKVLVTGQETFWGLAPLPMRGFTAEDL